MIMRLPNKPEKKLPLDAAIKPLLLLFHFWGFCIVLGEFYFEKSPELIYTWFIVISGILLIVREIYEEGVIWFFKTEGFITVLKLVLLCIIFAVNINKFIPLLAVLFLGILTSHIPKKAKKKIWIVEPVEINAGVKK